MKWLNLFAFDVNTDIEMRNMGITLQQVSLLKAAFREQRK
jgi:hypothetical protein